MRIKAICAYNGSRYSGWQKQPDNPSVEEEIEKVLSQILDEDITIYASGRTDAGVHALGQCFHFDISKEVDLPKLRYALNRVLKEDIHILSLEHVSDSFNARFDVKDKTYLYKVAFKEKLPIEGDLIYCHPFPTDVDKVIKALDLFKGTHNFQDFTSKEEDEKGFVRTIFDITTSFENDILTISITGDGFMRYMVRDIVGSAIAVGQKQIDEEFIKYHLENDKNREIVKYKAPSQGLYLLKVSY